MNFYSFIYIFLFIFLYLNAVKYIDLVFQLIT